MCVEEHRNPLRESVGLGSKGGASTCDIFFFFLDGVTNILTDVTGRGVTRAPHSLHPDRSLSRPPKLKLGPFPFFCPMDHPV